MSPETKEQIQRGLPFPLGASVRDGGCNFAVYSPRATQVEICFFDEDENEVDKVTLPARSGPIWYGFISGIDYNQNYGLRVHGPFNPDKGLYFNPHKLMIDPYAQSLSRYAKPGNLQFSYDTENTEDLIPCHNDSASQIPKCIVTSQDFDWQNAPSPYHSWSETLVYEAHVKGFTMNMPEIPDDIRGTYLGMAHESSVRYLKNLGISSIQLMPIYAFMTEHRLRDLSLSNYWGYNPINFFSPDPRYAKEDAVTEFKTLVREFHKENIEVILDVVYNHTAEGNMMGPTISFRGLNRDFYRLHPEDKTHYIDNSGCGNSTNLFKSSVLRLVMDSMRHWVTHYKVDGFRFDLATSMAREEWDYSEQSAFFKAIAQDPILSKVKLIAEPWDVGRFGYQLGQFPEEWYECNDKFRDTVRHFWRGDEGHIADFATRLMGSRDIFRKGTLETSTSLNFITYHDGFTLEDLVSYNHKHNQANRERNQDGHSHNISHNYGEEGVSSDPQVLALRARQKRNLLATLFLSQGSVHFLGGDEISNTQNGNNNAYCQDNEISWINWQVGVEQLKLLQFVQQMIKIRLSSRLIGDLVFTKEQLKHGPAESDEVHWFNPKGKSVTIEQWHDPGCKAIALLISNGVNSPAKELYDVDECFLVMINAHAHAQEFIIPACPGGGWKLIIDTAENDGITPPDWCLSTNRFELKSQSLVLLSHPEWSVN